MNAYLETKIRIQATLFFFSQYLQIKTQKGNSWNFISQIKKSILTNRNLKLEHKYL
jgi:hypothetical protein